MARETVDDQSLDTRHHTNGTGSDTRMAAMIPAPGAPSETHEEVAPPTVVSPQQFYRDAVTREDVRRILDALAK
jgi:hypothetical protein